MSNQTPISPSMTSSQPLDAGPLSLNRDTGNNSPDTSAMSAVEVASQHNEFPASLLNYTSHLSSPRTSQDTVRKLAGTKRKRSSDGPGTYPMPNVPLPHWHAHPQTDSSSTSTGFLHTTILLRQQLEYIGVERDSLRRQLEEKSTALAAKEHEILRKLEVQEREFATKETNHTTQENELRQELQIKERVLAERERDYKAKEDNLLQKLDSKEQELATAVQVRDKISESQGQLEARTHQLDSQLTQLNEQTRELEDEIKNAKEDAEFYKNEVVKALQKQKDYRDAMEYYQELFTVENADKTELQRLNIEDCVEQDRRMLGLPPSYATFADRNNKPPYNRHADGGGAGNLAQFEHCLRLTFTKALNAAQNKAARLFQSDDRMDRDEVGSKLIEAAIKALVHASRSVLDILDRISEVEAHPHTKQEIHDDAGKPYSLGKAFAADRFAKVMLELGQRVVAAFDVRGYDVTFAGQPTLKAKVGQAMREVDDNLKSILETAILGGQLARKVNYNTFLLMASDGQCRCTRALCSGHCDRLDELTFFLSSFYSVARVVDILLDMETYPGQETFLQDTLTWLSASAETERTLAANVPAA